MPHLQFLLSLFQLYGSSFCKLNSFLGVRVVCSQTQIIYICPKVKFLFCSRSYSDDSIMAKQWLFPLIILYANCLCILLSGFCQVFNSGGFFLFMRPIRFSLNIHSQNCLKNFKLTSIECEPCLPRQTFSIPHVRGSI